MKLDNSEMPALPKADWYESTVVPEDTPLYTEDQMRTAMRASADAQLAKLRDQKPVAWFRNENGMRVYYETEAWPDMQPLFAAPVPGGGQVQTNN